MIKVDAQELAKRLGVPENSPEVLERVSVAARGAIQILETQLETNFSSGHREDLIFLDANQHHGLIPNGLLRIRLSTGYISNPVITTGTSWNSIETPLPNSEVLVSETYGIVSLDKTYEGRYVKVAYDYGFEEYEELPEAVRQALVGWTRAVLLNGNGLGTKELEIEYRAVKEMAVALTAAIMRPKGFSFKPIL